MSTTPLSSAPSPNATGPSAPGRKRVTLHRLAQMREAGERIAMLTAYDASFARVLDDAGVDAILVGDSLGMVLQGKGDTLSVTLDDVAYHTRCVAAGARHAMVIADLPFGTYESGPEQAIASASRLMASGAQMVKLEGGAWVAPTVRFLVERGIPVCTHIGFTPQSVHALGGFRVQGRGEADAARLLADAEALADAGASMMVLEMIPAGVAGRITAALGQPTETRGAVWTIGIGGGIDCAGQVLVLHDLLGAASGVRPRFAKDFLAGRGSLVEAVQAYVADVKAGVFPGPEHSF